MSNSCFQIFNALSEAMIATHRCSKLLKNYTFVLQEFINKRLIIGDELEVDLVYFENILKNIFSGLLCEAKVKFGTGEYIDRTPFIILSNCFPMDQEIWNTSVSKYQSVPWLTENGYVTAPIHPYAWKKLFQKYGVIQ